MTNHLQAFYNSRKVKNTELSVQVVCIKTVSNISTEDFKVLIGSGDIILVLAKLTDASTSQCISEQNKDLKIKLILKFEDKQVL